MPQKTRIFNKFAYFAEDCDCHYCIYYRGKKGCGRAVCCCENERDEAVRHWRIKRKKEWSK